MGSKAKQDYERAYSVMREAMRELRSSSAERVNDLCFFSGRSPLCIQVLRCFLGLPVVFVHGGLAEEMARTLNGRGVLALAVGVSEKARG